MLKILLSLVVISALTFGDENKTDVDKSYSVAEIYMYKASKENSEKFIETTGLDNLFALIIDSAIDNTDFYSDLEETVYGFIRAFEIEEEDKMRDLFYRNAKMKEMKNFDFKTEIKKRIKEILALQMHPFKNEKYYTKSCTQADPAHYNFDKEIYFLYDSENALKEYFDQDYMYSLYGDSRQKITGIQKVEMPLILLDYDNFSFERAVGGQGIYLDMNIDLAKEVLNSQTSYYLPNGEKKLCIYKEFEIPKIGDNWFVGSLDFFSVAYLTERDKNKGDIRSSEVYGSGQVIKGGDGISSVKLNAHITRIEITSQDDDGERIIYSAEF